MHTIEIPDLKLKKHFPEDLSECNAQQYIDISALLFQMQSGKLSIEAFKVNALYILLNLKKTKTHKAIQEEKFANIWQVAQTLDSFFETIDEAKVLKTYYINNPIAYISNGLKRWYGPTDEFQNIKTGEYIDGLSHYADFIETGEIDYLYRLMATFYRRPKPFLWWKKTLDSYDNDPRKPYNSENVGRIADKLKYYPIGVIYGFYLLFASFQKYISTARLYIEGKEIDLSILFMPPKNQSAKPELPSLGMRSIINTMAESQIFGPLEKVRETSLYEILLRMYDISIKSANAEPTNT